MAYALSYSGLSFPSPVLTVARPRWPRVTQVTPLVRRLGRHENYGGRQRNPEGTNGVFQQAPATVETPEATIGPKASKYFVITA